MWLSADAVSGAILPLPLPLARFGDVTQRGRRVDSTAPSALLCWTEPASAV
jgi:hypothetical protein